MLKISSSCWNYHDHYLTLLSKSRSKAPLELRNLSQTLRRGPWRFWSWLRGLDWLKLASGCFSSICLPLINKGSPDDVLRTTTMLQAGRSVLIPGGGKRFFLQNIQMGSGDHPASYSLGIGRQEGGFFLCLPPWFDHANNEWTAAHNNQLFTVQFSSVTPIL